MGPLFSAAIAGIAIAVFAVAAFLVVRVFRDTWSSLQYAFAIVLGGVCGATVAVVLLVPFVGDGSTLTSTGAVTAYFACLLAGCTLGAAIASWFVARLKAAQAVSKS